MNLAIVNGPYLYIGWRVNGILNLFGWEVRVDIRIGDMVISAMFIVNMLQK